MDFGRQNLLGVHRGSKSSLTTIKSGAINCSRFLLDSRYHIFCPTPSELGDPDLNFFEISIYAGKAPLIGMIWIRNTIQTYLATLSVATLNGTTKHCIRVDTGMSV